MLVRGVRMPLYVHFEDSDVRRQLGGEPFDDDGHRAALHAPGRPELDEHSIAASDRLSQGVRACLDDPAQRKSSSLTVPWPIGIARS